jgi:hypothetical protein
MDILAFFAGGGSEAEGAEVDGSLCVSWGARLMWWASKGSKEDCSRSLEGIVKREDGRREIRVYMSGCESGGVNCEISDDSQATEGEQGVFQWVTEKKRPGGGLAGMTALGRCLICDLADGSLACLGGICGLCRVLSVLSEAGSCFLCLGFSLDVRWLFSATCAFRFGAVLARGFVVNVCLHFAI